MKSFARSVINKRGMSFVIQ